MCRNFSLMNNYKATFICIEHRHVAQFQDWIEPRCPIDREKLIMVGYDFKAPRKRDDAGWHAVKQFLQSGGSYNTCGCSRIVPIPTTPAGFRQEAVMNRPVPRKPRKRK